jgi:hypothetical protein
MRHRRLGIGFFRVGFTIEVTSWFQHDLYTVAGRTFYSCLILIRYASVAGIASFVASG